MSSQEARSAASPSPRERFEASHDPQDFLRWLNAYTNQGRADDELHALCSWAHSVIAALQNELATREPNQYVMNRRAER